MYETLACYCTTKEYPPPHSEGEGLGCLEGEIEGVLSPSVVNDHRVGEHRTTVQPFTSSLCFCEGVSGSQRFGCDQTANMCHPPLGRSSLHPNHCHLHCTSPGGGHPPTLSGWGGWPSAARGFRGHSLSGDRTESYTRQDQSACSGDCSPKL